MPPKYFDIHSHIQFPQFDADKDAVLQRMKDVGVSAFVVGTDAKSSEDALREVEGKEGLFATVGLHPNDVFDESFDVVYYRALASKEKVVAIGECGLDYFRTKPEKEKIQKQKEVLEAHIEIAVELGKPLMLHCRDPLRRVGGEASAHNDLIDILKSKKKEYGEKLKGNIHFFTGDTASAQKYFDLDFTISFTGVITFAHDYDEVVRYAPLANIMSETDCPYVAPLPYRGSRNEPSYVVEVVKRIAEIRQEDSIFVAKALLENAQSLFHV